jgi:hypothetical protein
MLNYYLSQKLSTLTFNFVLESYIINFGPTGKFMHALAVMIARVEGIKLFLFVGDDGSHVKAKYMTYMIPAMDAIIWIMGFSDCTGDVVGFGMPKYMVRCSCSVGS